MKKIPLLIGALLLLLLIILVVFLNRGGTDTKNPDSNDPVVIGDPLDTVSPFYNDWLDAVLSTSTDPYTSGLDQDDRLSEAVKNYLASNRQSDGSSPDPVLCQYNIPPRIGAKLSYNQDGKAQFLLLARGMGITPERAVVDMEHDGTGWKISKIECVSGESAPEREFTFEKQGFILKTDRPPLNPDTWYVVYEENGLDGHYAPLSFSTQSLCYDPSGTETVCDESNFSNASQVIVKGEMSEVGVNVKRVEFLD